jgi:hypothetical protein
MLVNRESRTCVPPQENTDGRAPDSRPTMPGRAVLVRSAAWAAAGAVLCVLWAPTRLPLLGDNQHYFFIAERAASGVPPHVSHFDPKHSLAALMTAAVIAPARALGFPDVLAARALSIAATAACVGLVWVLAWRVTRGTAGATTAGMARATTAGMARATTAHLAAAAMLGFDDFVFQGVMAGQPKTFATLFTLVAVLAGSRRRPFASGVAVALAFLCWQPAGLLLAAAAGPLLLEPRRARGLAMLALGFLLPNVAYEAYFWSVGALEEQLVQAYGFPARYMRGTWPPSAAGLVLHASWMAVWKEGGPTTDSIVPLSFALGLVAAWGVAMLRPRAVVRRLAADRTLLTATIALHALLPFLLWNYQGFPDRFLLLPFFAIGAAWLWTVPLHAARSGRARRAAGAFAGIAVAGAAVVLLARWPTGVYTMTLQQQERLAERVGGMLARGDSVWALGSTHLLALAHTNNFSRYGFFFRGLPAFLRATHGARVFEPRRDGALPDVVLLARNKKRAEWLEKNYVEETPREFRHQGVRVWRRRAEAE